MSVCMYVCTKHRNENQQLLLVNILDGDQNK